MVVEREVEKEEEGFRIICCFLPKGIYTSFIVLLTREADTIEL